MEQRSNEWYQARMGKVTASNIRAVLSKPTTERYKDYQAEIICGRLVGEKRRDFTSVDIEHGKEFEDEARAMYEFDFELVTEVGFIEHPTIPFSGASPDGLVGENGLIEIKCPKTSTHINTICHQKIDPDYLAQMQWQMAVTGRKWCDFVSYDPDFIPRPLHVIRIMRDDAHIADMEQAVRDFLADVERKINLINGSANGTYSNR